MTKTNLVLELHKRARRNFPRRKVIIKGLHETFQADLVDMQLYTRENSGFKYILTVIDTFSKKAWAVPIKNKDGVSVANAFESILKKNQVCNNLCTDRGKGFYCAPFQTLMRKFNIHHYSSFSPLKAVIAERFDRSLKEIMWVQFSLNGNYKYLKILFIS